MEDSTTFRPVSVKTAGLQKSVTLLEEEVIVNELLLLSCSHRTKRIECTGKLTFEGVTSLDDFLFDLVSLLSSDGRSEREFFQVTADPNAS